VNEDVTQYTIPGVANTSIAINRSIAESIGWSKAPDFALN